MESLEDARTRVSAMEIVLVVQWGDAANEGYHGAVGAAEFVKKIYVQVVLGKN